jgi:hypothetical protein
VEPTRTDRSTRSKALRRDRVPNVGLMAASASRARRVIALSIVLAGDEPPNEFRIFTAGKVDSTKGSVLFDEAAAKSVMAEYTTHGIDLMIDYDHASLGMAIDPALAGKAAGWFNLAVRNGELWAVNVRWTGPAADALRRKEWRFMSPAFNTDADGRVTSVLNVAITNLPATRRLEPLMAASVTALGENGMDPKRIAEALDALIAGDAEKSMEILKGLIASAAGGEPAAAVEEPAAMAETAPVEEEEEKPAEVAAALSKIIRLSGKTSFVDALADIEVWHASHLKLETETQKLAQERKTLEDAERRKLCVDRVAVAGKAPAEVWADPLAAALVPKAYLLSMPIADLRAMCADEIKASAGKGGAPKPPVKLSVVAGALPAAGGKLDEFGNDEREQAICKETKCAPKTFAMLKARRATNA